MAYPGEKEHVQYLQYVERVSVGDEPGPVMPKDEWRKKQKDNGNQGGSVLVPGQGGPKRGEGGLIKVGGERDK